MSEKAEIMTIEIDEKDFGEIQDKLGQIIAKTHLARQSSRKDIAKYLGEMATESLVIAALLLRATLATAKSGTVQAKPETTKFIEHYDHWMCR